MSVWRMSAFAIANGVFWGVLIHDEPKGLVLAVLVTFMWLVTFDRES